MARQVSGPIDLRTGRQRAGGESQEMAQAIARIMQTVGAAENKRREGQTLDRVARAIASGKTTIQAITDAAIQEPEFSTGIKGGLQKLAGAFAPPGGGIKQSIVGAALQQALISPLEAEYKEAQIEATKALTKQRDISTEQALPDRMLRQADRWLRIVDDVMSEYWYTPEGPYRDKLLKDAQRAREKAMKLIEKYGVDSEAGKVSKQQLERLDEEIKKAGGKVTSKPTPIKKPPKLDDFFRGDIKSPTGGDIIGSLKGTPAQKKAIGAIVDKRISPTDKQALIKKILNNERIEVKDNAGKRYTLPASQLSEWLAIGGNTLAIE